MMKHDVHMGSLLVAEPFMLDTNFRRSVVLVTDHTNDEGTVGFIINKTLSVKINDLVEDFPEIDLSRSIIAGNKPSDMLFGKNAGMYSVVIASTHPQPPFPHPEIDLRFNGLPDFAKACLSADRL